MSSHSQHSDDGERGPVVDDTDDGMVTGEAGQIESRVSRRIRELRRDRGMTLQTLAEKAGVSKSMISKVERGEASPSAATVARLAAGLGVTISSLLGEHDRHDVLLLRRADQAAFVDPETGFERRSMSPIFPSRGLDLVQVTVPQGATAGPFVGHRYGVEEYLVVVEGRLGVTVGGVNHVLQTGDAIFYQAHVAHQYANLGEGPAVALVVIGDIRDLREGRD